MERWTKGLCELPDKFLRTGLEGLCSNILNRNAGTNSQTGLWVEGIRERRKRKRKLRTKTKGSAAYWTNWNSIFRRFSGLCTYKIQHFKRFTPASTLALDI
ncbi:unnamed protein product [Rhizophagus irregularis]|nr:unnamed protein product [Rhizophagus irregularis]